MGHETPSLPLVHGERVVHVAGNDVLALKSAIEGGWRILLPLPEDLEVYGAAAQTGCIQVAERAWSNGGYVFRTGVPVTQKAAEQVLRFWFGLSWSRAYDYLPRGVWGRAEDAATR